VGARTPSLREHGTTGLGAQGPGDTTSSQQASGNTGNRVSAKDVPALGVMSGSASGELGTASVTSATAPSSVAGSPSDAQIAQIAGDANDGEIAQGRYAILHANTPSVRGFAQHMVTAHGDIGRTMTEMVKAQNLVPAPSAQSIQIHADGQKTLDLMKASPAADFDRTYIAAQIKEHQGLLDALDTKLISSAQNAALKASLQKIRPMVAEHLKEAQDIQASSSH
jgi:putative membrane protein